MGYKASHRYARISATKVRPLANMIRGKYADEALEILRFQPQRGARMLEKVLKSALANAEDRRAPNLGSLSVVEVRVDGGPMIKRLKPKARGMAAKARTEPMARASPVICKTNQGSAIRARALGTNTSHFGVQPRSVSKPSSHDFAGFTSTGSVQAIQAQACYPTQPTYFCSTFF